MDEKKVKEMAIRQDERLWNAVACIGEMMSMPQSARWVLRFYLSSKLIRDDDGWVVAARQCTRNEDMPLVALQFFRGDVKEGKYDCDLHAVQGRS